jgi:hypothetical protein
VSGECRCGHTEVEHTVVSLNTDRCEAFVDGGRDCSCTLYEPKNPPMSWEDLMDLQNRIERDKHRER